MLTKIRVHCWYRSYGYSHGDLRRRVLRPAHAVQFRLRHNASTNIRLLEEEVGSGSTALVAQRPHPIPFHGPQRPFMRAALGPDDDPADAVKIQIERFQQ